MLSPSPTNQVVQHQGDPLSASQQPTKPDVLVRTDNKAGGNTMENFVLVEENFDLAPSIHLNPGLSRVLLECKRDYK